MSEIKDIFAFDNSCIVVEFNSEEHNLEKFTALVRSKFEDNNFSKGVDSWISDFSEATFSNWVVWKTFPHPIRYIYKKILKCQHSCLNKSKAPLATGKSRQRNLNCNASITIIVKKITKDTIKNDQYLKQGLNVEVKVNS